jgi:hypothetical protein
MYSCENVIQKRKELWNEYKSIEKDRGYTRALAKSIVALDKQGEKLREQIQHDKTLMIEMIFTIDDKEGNTVPFFPNEAQQIIKKHYKKNNSLRALVLKARQLGVSSYVTALQLVIGITEKNFQGYTVADNGDSTANVFEKAKSYYNPLPLPIKPTEKYNNKKEFRWAKDDGTGMNSSWGVSSAGKTTKDGRVANSFTIHFLHVSELAWWKSIDKTLSGLLDACTPGACIVFESTANGFNEFQKRWDKAVKGKSEYVPIFIPWYIQTEYRKDFESEIQKEDFTKQVRTSNEEIFKNMNNYMNSVDEIGWEQLWWYYRKYVDDKNESIHEMKQEFPTEPNESFVSSGNPVFNINNVQRKLVEARNKHLPQEAFNAYPQVIKTDNIQDRVNFDYIEMPIKDEEWPDANIFVFEKPLPDCPMYVIGADVAEGNEGADYSSASIFRADNWKQVVQIHGHWEADEFGYLLYEWGKKYDWAYMMVEHNNHGLTTNTTLLKELNYPEQRFHFRYQEDKKQDKQTRKMGWWTGNNKFLMIDELRTAAVNTNEMVIKDYKTFEECMTYVRDDKGSYNAQSGAFDDRIIDKAIAWQGRKYATAQIGQEDVLSWNDW